VNRKALIIGLAIVLPVIVLLAVSFGRDPHKVKSPLIGRQAPEFALPSAGDKQTVSLAALRGKPVVLNFWATWCVPCYAEHEVLRSTAATMGDSVQFLGVVYDDTEPKILQFLAQNGSAYPSLMDDGGKTAIAYGVYGVPETFFIDANGKIVDKFEGALDPATIQKLIARAIESGNVKVADR
jgi:cytochrome c biogenesis protein CcmG/thiol:disulfide interchange protein DsbE